MFVTGFLQLLHVLQDHRFSDEIDKLTGYKTQSILCMAICNSDGDVIGVVQAINKKPLNGNPFTEDDEKVSCFIILSVPGMFYKSEALTLFAFTYKLLYWLKKFKPESFNPLVVKRFCVTVMEISCN